MLSGEELRRRGVVQLADAAAVAAHVQPNGIDLSLDTILSFDERGALGVSNDDRRLPTRHEMPFDADGWLDLPPGTYGVRYAEPVALPVDCGGLCFPRSSLLRMGLHVPTAVWDAGYNGRGEGLLVVNNPHGVRLQRGARIAQLVAFRLSEPALAGYAGRYQNENG
ncbi:MAG TPA: deoxyuridine 5'-triphosphate nucleotidohydrolase [Chloroflexota bacterium]|nr:deoxyuridine 5'-triphosphate nucleotidohydrolase [Chloroflexota bacterium]